MTLANAVGETTDFNSRLQPSSIRAAAGVTNLLTLGYTYGTQPQSNNGNLQTQTISFAAIGGAPAFSEVQTYASYDALNRLVTAQTGTWTQTNGYDRYGNRWVQDHVNLPSLTEQTPRTDTWFTQKNRIKYHPTSPPPDAWQYDGAGNLTAIASMGGRSFTTARTARRRRR